MSPAVLAPGRRDDPADGPRGAEGGPSACGAHASGERGAESCSGSRRLLSTREAHSSGGTGWGGARSRARMCLGPARWPLSLGSCVSGTLHQGLPHRPSQVVVGGGRAAGQRALRACGGDRDEGLGTWCETRVEGRARRGGPPTGQTARRRSGGVWVTTSETGTRQAQALDVMWGREVR